MNPADPLYAELTTLIALRLEGRESTESAARLDSLLLTRDDACKLYIQLADMIAFLSWEVPFSEAELPAVPDDVAAPLVRPSKAVSLSTSWRLPLVFRPAFWSVVCAAVLFAGYFVAISWNMLAGNKAAQPGPLAHEDTQPPAEAVATMTGDDDARWSQSPRTVRAGESLVLTSGIARLQLRQGTTLHIEGPAAWTIDGSNRATLSHGKLIAQVPGEAAGFTLDTPSAQIVDLGTEFIVEVERSGESDVHVTQGKVNVQVRPAAGPPVLRSLHAGQGVRIVTGGNQLQARSSIPERFERLVKASQQGPQGSEASQLQERRGAVLLIDLKQQAKFTCSSQIGLEYPPQNAADGDRGTVFHSDNDAAAWWQVDLGSSKTVAVVEIYNLPGSRLGRFRDITIKVLAEDGSTVVASSPLLNPGNSLGGGEADWWLGPMRLEHNFRRSATGPVAGRFVRVERTGCAVPGSDNDQMVLTLAEVQVFEERIASESEPVSGGRQ